MLRLLLSGIRIPCAHLRNAVYLRTFHTLFEPQTFERQNAPAAEECTHVTWSLPQQPRCHHAGPPSYTCLWGHPMGPPQAVRKQRIHIHTLHCSNYKVQECYIHIKRPLESQIEFKQNNDTTPTLRRVAYRDHPTFGARTTGGPEQSPVFSLSVWTSPRKHTAPWVTNNCPSLCCILDHSGESIIKSASERLQAAGSPKKASPPGVKDPINQNVSTGTTVGNLQKKTVVQATHAKESVSFIPTINARQNASNCSLYK